MKKNMILIFLISLAVSPGCRTIESFKTPVIKAVFASRPVIIDGKLNDEVWRYAEGYNMVALAPNEPSTVPEEKTIVYFAWDKNNFYVAVKCFDSDIAATGNKDEIHHYNYGDVIELFLKPDDQSWYWELYSTPAGKKTTFFFPGKGRLGMVNKVKKVGLRVASQCKGTLNNWSDKDVCWTTEMAISRKEIEINGVALSPATKWRILVARYNYSRYLKKLERSSYPRLTEFSFHSLESYAHLLLVKRREPMSQIPNCR